MEASRDEHLARHDRSAYIACEDNLSFIRALPDEIYSHAIPAMEEEAAAKIAALFMPA